MTSRALHFEIPVDDPERAGSFYRRVLGWEPHRFGDVPYWNVADDPEADSGIAGAFTLRSEAPSGTLVYVGVADLDGVLALVTAAGGAVVTPASAVPGVGRIARIRDSEGNVVGLIQPDR